MDVEDLVPFRYGGGGGNFMRRASGWRRMNPGNRVFDRCRACGREYAPTEQLYGIYYPGDALTMYTVCRRCAYQMGAVIEPDGRMYSSWENWRRRVSIADEAEERAKRARMMIAAAENTKRAEERIARAQARRNGG